MQTPFRSAICTPIPLEAVLVIVKHQVRVTFWTVYPNSIEENFSNHILERHIDAGYFMFLSILVDNGIFFFCNL